jgi:DNA-binding GntR family transcriptional regulator
MSAASLFRPGGDFYSPIPDPIFDLLEPARRPAAILVARYLVKKEQAGRFDERITDEVIVQATGLSQRSVQRALRGLEGLGMIRRRRSHGRRVITITGTLLRARQIEQAQP